MSKSTLISIVPFPISEEKPGIFPGIFNIPGSKDGIPQLLTIGDSIYHVEVDENKTIVVPCPSETVAKSIIEDYVISQLAFNREEDCAPGLFYVTGEKKLQDIQIHHSGQLKNVHDRQMRWFKKLVTIADDDWEKTRQHKSISDFQRFAAKALNLQRPWIINIEDNNSNKTSEVKTCIACRSIVSIKAIICSACKCILNPEEYKKIQFAEAVK